MRTDWIDIDGSEGEGGGQMLRSSLALSILTGRPVRFHHLRARRTRPGLQPQHLRSVLAAAEICHATVLGAELQSQFLTFIPGHVDSGDYHFQIGTAGATTLVLHTVFLPLILRGQSPSTVRIEGGTHNDKAPSADFVSHTWAGHLRTLGLEVSVKAERLGFYPRGGGVLAATLQPSAEVQPLELVDVVATTTERWEFTALVAGRLPASIGERMVQQVQARLGPLGRCSVVSQEHTLGPGVVATLIDRRTAVPSTFFALGERGKPAERVADEAVDAYLAHRDTGRPVDSHSADQLLLPLAFAMGPSRYAVSEVTQHLLTNLEIIRRFVEREMICDGELGGPGVVSIGNAVVEPVPTFVHAESAPPAGPEAPPPLLRPMPDEKRKLREEKRVIKRAGQKHARREAKRALREDPENAQDVGQDYGRWSTEHRK